MRKNLFLDYIHEADFKGLFISEMGWNNYRGQAMLPLITIEDVEYQFYTIAERSGFQILQCEVDTMPTPAICKRIDTKLRRSANDYLAIYILKNTEHHLWVAPVRQMEKRDLVSIEYETPDKADFIYSKIDDLSFGNSEVTTIIDVKERIQGTFAINSEKVTKDFYAGFKKEHDAFAKFITGIDDQITDLKKNRNKQWYTSVMLNRLMFCYFIQKKGFLDGNVNYLRDKLNWCKQQQGEDQFFRSFYLQFLIHLFQDGLNDPTHSGEFEKVYGRIPYLNGGMFDKHQLEHDYQDIDISDEAFERLFDFFDKWRWHLDTRIEATGKDINPDVLGYIFEQYINDRAQMGAYYTKEDITEYIGRNCILPFLFNKVQHATREMEQVFTTSGEVWTLLKNSGDRYIYDAVKHGYSDDWAAKIPEDISVGIDTTQPNLLERRKEWNRPTPEPWALPTEIWRESIERLQRCGNILGKIEHGEITQINDFITYNLDIRSFATDVIGRTANPHLVRHFYKALQEVTILDPTCGSGAFLFAAMNILEPLYEVCIDRMQDFHAQNANLFKDELDEIEHKYRSNIQYFIYKSIILRNLYGVDIMTEATEIAKLRLFLKMVAVVEANRRLPNLGLDPLPDIDFNIRCGNTLVGYASEDEVVNGAAYVDIFTAQEFREKVELELEKVSMAYNHFRTQQLADADDRVAFKAAKNDLSLRLNTLTDMLDHQLFSASGKPDFDEWKASHQPFHWIAEYYQIIHGNGGFDVIIGNPPYVEYNKKEKATGKAVSDIYKLDGYKTLSCGNLYAYCIERSKKLINCNAGFGMIVPISLICTKRMQVVQSILIESGILWYSNYAERPSKLFTGAEVLLTIFINHSKSLSQLYSTKFTKWTAIQRPILFQSIAYSGAKLMRNYIIPKYTTEIENLIAHKMTINKSIGNDFSNIKTNPKLYYRIGGGRYWKIFTTFQPIFILNGEKSVSSRENYLFFDKENERDIAVAVLSSSLFYWFFIMTTNCRDLNPSDLELFPFNLSQFSKDNGNVLESCCSLLMNDYNKFSLQKDKISTKTGNVRYQEFYPRYSKPIIDDIDKVLAKHYGFTEEELDFIINYDIKYRMGGELNNEEE
ncbi:MAG: Eco57I restriction-modification methylase domain-containing protein [Parabacteroides sp.]|nr:Eco57I restriction-modification methylase domain-containing protein [Parabacteroides sp.]